MLRSAIACLALVAILAGGCASSPPTGLYLLAALPQPAPAQPFPNSLGIGPVSLPDYLDRLQIVTRAASGEIAVSDTERWAEPLHEGLARVLDENLAALLGTQRIVRFPWPASLAPDVQVAVEVLRFDVGPGASLRLEARWSVRAGGGETVVEPNLTRIEVPSGNSADQRVRAHSEAASRLAREIASALWATLRR
jgi:uncharacterized lipoprotein YmbA